VVSTTPSVKEALLEQAKDASARTYGNTLWSFASSRKESHIGAMEGSVFEMNMAEWRNGGFAAPSEGSTSGKDVITERDVIHCIPQASGWHHSNLASGCKT
jgi:hypothetical protein